MEGSMNLEPVRKSCIWKTKKLDTVRRLNTIKEDRQIYDLEIKQKELENRRLKENIEEQKRSSLEKEKQLLKRIGELKEELTRLKESYRNEM